LGSSNFGIGYERIDPGYQTLGTFFMNNDLENITVRFAKSLFKGKLQFSGNLGVQRDDLNRKKSGNARRTVMAFNLILVGGKKFTGNLSYSNFQTVTNVKPQFHFINQTTILDNLDTLDFRQLSQNGSLNLNFILSENKKRPSSMNLNFSIQDSYDLQGGIITVGNASRFYNFSGNISKSNMDKHSSFTSGFNATYNLIGKTNFLIFGPSIGYNKALFKKRLTSGVGVSYNSTLNNSNVVNTIFNLRFNSGFQIKKKHSFNLAMVSVFLNQKNTDSKKELVNTITYNYSF
jgi:hypothetical protein